MKEEGVKKRVGKKKKKEKKFSFVFRERILRCDVCVCVRAFSSSGAFRIDRLSSSRLSLDAKREQKKKKKKKRERRAQSILIFARGPTCCRGVFLRRAEGRIELGR